jgi:hypothetical protein
MKTATENKITALFMGRTDKTTGLWFPVQKMTWTYSNGEYSNCITVFTNGAKKLEKLHPQQPNIVTFGSLSQIIESPNIDRCPWSNRMPINQEPNCSIIEFLGLDHAKLDPVKYVAISGGYRHSDLRNIFPEVQADENGSYNFIFRNVDSYSFSTENRPELNNFEEAEEVIPTLVEGKLQLNCRGLFLGYAPPYIRELYKKHHVDLEISIYKVNHQAPFEYQFLLLATLDREIAVPFSEPEFETYKLND